MKAITLLAAGALAAFTFAATAEEPAKDSPPFRELREKIAKAKADGREDEVERLMAEAKKLHGGMKPGDQRPGAEHHERLAKARQEIEELHKAGKHAEAEKLQQKVMEGMKKLHGPKGGPPEHLSAEAREHIEKTRKQIEELHRAGKHEEANRMRDQLIAGMRARHGQPPGKESTESEGPARLRHVMAAIGHLREAGLGEQAEQLEKAAHKMREEFEASHRREAEHRKTDEPKKHKDHKRPGPGPDQIRQLQEQLEKITREVSELREAVRKQQPREEVRKAD